MSLFVPALARMSAKSSLRGRRFLMVLLVSLVPALLGAALIAADASRHATEGASFRFQANLAEPVTYLVLGGTVPFVAVLLAGSLVADDVEDRTFSYLLVRPLRRAQIYMSRFLPALGLAVALAALQVLSFGILRFVSWSLYGANSLQTVYTPAAHSVPTIDLLLGQIPLAMLAAALAAAAYLALFSFVTVLTTKYHFLTNLLVFAAVELPFGNLGGQGAGVVTVTYHARSLLMAANVDDSYHPSHWALAVVVLLGMVALWTWLATRQMGRRDFNITSAAS